MLTNYLQQENGNREQQKKKEKKKEMTNLHKDNVWQSDTQTHK